MTPFHGVVANINIWATSLLFNFVPSFDMGLDSPTVLKDFSLQNTIVPSPHFHVSLKYPPPFFLEKANV